MSDDTGFLGETFTVIKLGKEKYTSYWNAKPEDVQALRTALDRAFAALEPASSIGWRASWRTWPSASTTP